MPASVTTPSDQKGNPTYPILSPRRNKGPEMSGPRVLARQPTEAAAPLIVAR